MTNYREILRLDSLGLNKTQIADACDCSRTTVISVSFYFLSSSTVDYTEFSAASAESTGYRTAFYPLPDIVLCDIQAHKKPEINQTKHKANAPKKAIYAHRNDN